MNDEIDVELSHAGQDRRERMLPELIDVMQRVHRARRVRRRVIAGFLPVIGVALVIAAWIYATRPQSTPPPIIAENKIFTAPLEGTRGNDAAPPVVATIIRVQTDPFIVDRYRAVAESRAVVLDDDSLLTALARIERPTGLIRSEGRVWLTSNVVDKPLNEGTGL